MNQHIEKLKNKYKDHFTRKEFLISCGIALVFLSISFVINYYAAAYALSRESNSVTDIILSNIPTFNVDEIFVYGPIIFWFIIALFTFHDPKKIPFTMKSIALFILTRSIFITLTHIGPSPDRIILDALDWNILKTFTSSTNFFLFSSGGDLFFSGHTGLPFLMALVFWNNKSLRVFCLLSAIMFGIIVLMGHLHYSIDVASAFFITYTIFHIAEWLWKKDRLMFLSHATLN